MLLSLIILLVFMVLSGVPVSGMTPLAGTVLFVKMWGTGFCKLRQFPAQSVWPKCRNG